MALVKYIANSVAARVQGNISNYHANFKLRVHTALRNIRFEQLFDDRTHLIRDLSEDGPTRLF